MMDKIFEAQHTGFNGKHRKIFTRCRRYGNIRVGGPSCYKHLNMNALADAKNNFLL